MHRLADGRQLLVCHGDEYDLVVQHSRLLSLLGTWAYDHLVELNRLVNGARALVGLGRWSFSQAIKKKVKGACTFISKFEEVLVEEAKRRSLDGVVCGHIHEPRVELRADGLIYANCGDWIERASALVEHTDGRLEIVDVERMLRDLGWKPEATEDPEHLEHLDHPVHLITEELVHAK
jgi:UDP-2,3-diacylglucosamine pyrophosphatase LpxH